MGGVLFDYGRLAMFGRCAKAPLSSCIQSTRRKRNGLRGAGRAALAVIITTVLSGGALAQSFQPVIDEFWIIKNGQEIFRDSFNDGLLPPSGPDGPSTYSSAVTAGLGGMTNESGGALTMTPAFGNPTLITGNFANTHTTGFRLSPNPPTDTSNVNSLLFGDAFELHGLFDLSTSALPVIPGQAFGVGLTDRFTPTNAGDDVLRVLVGRSSSTNALGVVFVDLSFAGNTSQVVSFDSLAGLPPFTSNSQIELMLSKASNTNEIFASWKIDSGAWVLMDNINNVTLQPASIYNGENYTRAQFFANDANVNLAAAVPEPEIYAMLGFGLAVLGWVRRRKKVKEGAPA